MPTFVSPSMILQYNVLLSYKSVRSVINSTQAAYVPALNVLVMHMFICLSELLNDFLSPILFILYFKCMALLLCLGCLANSTRRSMQIYPQAQPTHIMVRMPNNQAFISAISRNLFTSLL